LFFGHLSIDSPAIAPVLNRRTAIRINCFIYVFIWLLNQIGENSIIPGEYYCNTLCVYNRDRGNSICNRESSILRLLAIYTYKLRYAKDFMLRLLTIIRRGVLFSLPLTSSYTIS